MSTCSLNDRHCIPCEGGVPALDAPACAKMLTQLQGWTLDGTHISKIYGFSNHYEVMAFVNAVAWVSHRQEHHPEITFGYKDVTVRYWTHAIGGLSENDFICAAHIDRLIQL